jgi:hypothetical protein
MAAFSLSPVRNSLLVFSHSAYLRSVYAFLCVLSVSTNAFAADGVEIRDVGFSGYFAVGRMTQLTANVTLDESAEVVVRVGVPDPQGNIVHFNSVPTNVAAQGAQAVTVAFQSGQLGAPILVEVLAEEKVIASTRRVLGENSGMLSPGVKIVGLLGQPEGVPQWFNAQRIVIPFSGENQSGQDGEVTRSKSEAKTLADEVLQKLNSGDADFDELQAEYSEAAGSAEIFTANADNANMVAALRTVAIGSVGGPFAVDQSYQIVKRNRLPDDIIAEQQNARLFLDLIPSQLPEQASGLAAMDSLVIAGDYQLSEMQVQAISEWVRFGGHLLMSVGSDVDSYRSSPLGKQLQQWIPIEEGTSRLAELPGFSSFTNSSSISIPTGKPVPAARIGQTPGKTLISGLDGPLVEQRMVGFGRLTFIGVDITNGPMVKWDGLPVLVNRLVFDEKRTRDTEEAIQSDAIGHNGITDFATQLHASTTNFPTVKRPSSWVAMSFILLYLFAIGPVDYFLVHRVLKRPRLTWITFPLMVIAGCAFGIWMAGASNGTDIKLTQTSVVDIDASVTNAYRLRSWSSVYSPEARRAELTAVPSAELIEGLGGTAPKAAPLLWTGVAENVFGGMLRSGGASLGTVSYDVKNNLVQGLPIPVWSTGNLQIDWRGETKMDSANSEPLVEARLTTTSAGKLRGSVKHNLPFPIKNWIVAHGLLAYYPRDTTEQDPEIPPGKAWSPQDPRFRSRDLESYLTGVRIVHVERKMGEGGDDTKQSKQEYDALELDAEYCLRILSLHEAAGGTRYTGLTNNLLQDMDFSRAIDLNTAVLFGEIDVPVGTLSLDGTKLTPTRSRTFVRIMLPVERSERSRR